MRIHWYFEDGLSTETEGVPPAIGTEVVIHDARLRYSRKKYRVVSVIHQIWRAQTDCSSIAGMRKGSAEANLAAFQAEHDCVVDHLDTAGAVVTTAKQTCEVTLDLIPE